jgi:hypothetical protein
VVYVEGEGFAASRHNHVQAAAVEAAGGAPRRWLRLAAYGLGLGLGLAAVGVGLSRLGLVTWLPRAPSLGVVTFSTEQVVHPGESISAAIARATSGSQVLVEPGEYREQIRLRDGIRVVSRAPREATLRLPAGAAASDAAVVATGLTAGNLAGFRIVGDAATPLGIGILAHDATLSIVDVEITGATEAAVDLRGAGVSLVGSDVHDNPGVGLVIRAGATPRIANSTFARNGTPDRAAKALVIEGGARPRFTGNVFRGVGPDAFRALDATAREDLARDNWFAGLHTPRPVPAAPNSLRPRP